MQEINDSLGYRVAKAVQNMAFKSLFAFSVLFLFTYCEAKPESCSEARCKLSPVGEGFASEFRNKASEKGVRLVYLNLKIGNDSYDPLELHVQDEFLPHRWVWANTISEPMLSLLDDYDILSLGLLNYQVRSMDVQLDDQPRGCLANLNSTCQNLAVGRMLLQNVTMGSSDELSHETRVVCVAALNWSVEIHQHINYNCCGMHKGPNGPSILCDLTFYGRWFNGFDGIIITLWILMSLFIPALPLLLPDCLFSLRRECNKENRSGQRNNTVGPADQQSNQAIKPRDQEASDDIRNEQREEESVIPVDDASPMTFSTLLLKWSSQTMPNVGLSFNIKLFLAYVCVFPCVIYVQLGLYNTLKKTHINESIKRRISLGKVFTKYNNWSIFVTLGVKEIIWIATLTFTSFARVLFFRPGDFIFKQGIFCPICKEDGKTRGSHHSLGDEMRLHFKLVHRDLWKAILYFTKLVTSDISKLCPCKKCPQASRTMHPIYVLLRSIFILITLLLRVVFGAICFLLCLLCSLVVVLWYSPLVFILLFYVSNGSRLGHLDVDDKDDCKNVSSLKLYRKILLKLNALSRFLVRTLLSASFFYTFYMVVAVSCDFINKILGYITAGLVLNEDVITPYVAFFLVVTTNIYLCYANMQNKYKEVKEIVLKWQKEFEININDPEGTIRTQLFWFVCDRVLPIEYEICRMFCSMVLILFFLFLVVYSIIVFGSEYKASALLSTIYVFVGGLIPALVFKGLTKGNKFTGRAKIRIEREIERAVTEYRNSTDIELGPCSTGNDTIVNEGVRRILVKPVKISHS